MEKMKNRKKDYMQEVENLLQYLEDNYYDEEKRMEVNLVKKFKSEKDFDKLLDFCFFGRGYVRRKVHGKGTRVKNRKERDFELVIEPNGSHFLEERRRTKREIRSHRFQKQLVMTSLILALGVIFSGVNLTEVLYKDQVLIVLLIMIVGLTINVLIDFYNTK